MNINRGFILAMALLAVLAFMFSYRNGVEYNYSNSDLGYDNRQPQGIRHVDEVLSQAMPRGYETVANELFSLTHVIGDSITGEIKPDALRYNYLFVADEGYNIDDAVSQIDELIEHGSTVMVVTDARSTLSNILYYAGLNTFFKGDYTYLSLDDRYCAPRDEVRITWNGDSVTTTADPPGYWLPEVYVSRNVNTEEWDVDEDDIYNTVVPLPQPRYQPLIQSADGDTLAIRVTSPERKGALIIGTMPRLFTNFAVAHHAEARNLMLRLMSLLADKPVRRLRAEDKVTDDELDETADVLMRSPAMRAAYLLTIVTCLLAIVFTARRRQRVIPVIEPPANRVMEMTLNVGDLYYRRHDNVDLVMKRYAMFVDAVRRALMLDLETDDRATIVRELATATGTARDEVEALLDAIAQASTSDELPDATMISIIDRMDRLEAGL